MNIFPWTKVISSNKDNLFIKNNNFFESDTVNWEKQHVSNPDAFKLKKTMNKNWYLLFYSAGWLFPSANICYSTHVFFFKTTRKRYTRSTMYFNFYQDPLMAY